MAFFIQMHNLMTEIESQVMKIVGNQYQIGAGPKMTIFELNFIS